MTAPLPDRPLDPIGGLGFLLDRVAHSLARGFLDVLAPFGVGNMQLGVLSTLQRHGPMNQSAIAAYLGVERQQMVNLVKQLEDQGLVERHALPHDRRSWSIRLTDLGTQVRDRAVTAGSHHAEQVFGHLSEQERTALGEILVKLIPHGRFDRLFSPPAAGGG